MRKNTDFNQTHSEYLDGKGLLLDVPSVVHYLNEIFNDLTKIEGFKYHEISTVHGTLLSVLSYASRYAPTRSIALETAS